MKKRILIIDDEPDFIEMIQMRLEANDYDVISENDGASGIDRARDERPDLILLDVMMPVMDGYETLFKIRQEPSLLQVPVIMLTAKGESRAIFKAQELGATDYLIKPCDSKDLLSLMAKHA